MTATMHSLLFNICSLPENASGILPKSDNRSHQREQEKKGVCLCLLACVCACVFGATSMTMV